ncbi:MAG: MMPL family transporter [Burkholderiaceae bacterium]
MTAERPAPRWPLLVWLAALALGALVIAQARFSADLSAFLPATPDARQRALIDQLKSGTAARTLFVGIEGGSVEQRAAASKQLAAALRADSRFEQVQNGEREALAAAGQWLFERRYLLSPAVEPRRFRSDGLREAIDDTVSLLGTPAGALVKPILERDPTGETRAIAEAALGASGPRSEQGAWVSRDGARAVLVLQTRAPGSDLDGQQAAIDALKAAFAQARGAITQARAEAPLQLLYTGAPRFAVESREQIRTEASALAVAGTVLMGGLLLVAFASVVALGVAALPVATGVVAGIAAVALGSGSVHGVTLGFGTTLIGEAVDYAIYYLVQARGAGPSRGQGWRAWVGSGWPTVRLGLLTSVCGFLALVFSGFPGLAQLGVYSIAGLVAAALTTRHVLPVLTPDGARGVGARAHLGRWAQTAVRVLPRWRHAFTALALAAAALLVWKRDSLWQAELSSLSPVSAQLLALDEQLRADVGANESGTLVVVHGADLEATLVQAEAAAARLDAWVQDGRLAGYQSVARWLPSQATQRARLAALPTAAALDAALAQATADGPLPASRLGPFVDDVQRSRQRAPITLAEVQAGPLGPLAGALLLASETGGYTALLPLQPGREATSAARVQAALDGVDSAQAIDIGDELRRLYRHYLREAQWQALLGALGVVLLVALWLRSLPRLVAVCQPLALAVVITMGLAAALRVPLGILHLVGLLLVVAVGSNYALYFDMLRHQRSADPDTLASLLLANLTTVVSFGLIAASEIPALSAIGRVVAPGSLLALLLAAAYAPRASSTGAVGKSG